MTRNICECYKILLTEITNEFPVNNADFDLLRQPILLELQRVKKTTKNKIYRSKCQLVEYQLN